MSRDKQLQELQKKGGHLDLDIQGDFVDVTYRTSFGPQRFRVRLPHDFPASAPVCSVSLLRCDWAA